MDWNGFIEFTNQWLYTFCKYLLFLILNPISFLFLVPVPAFSPIRVKPQLRCRRLLRGRINQPDLPRPELIGNPDNQLTNDELPFNPSISAISEGIIRKACSTKTIFDPSEFSRCAPRSAFSTWTGQAACPVHGFEDFQKPVDGVVIGLDRVVLGHLIFCRKIGIGEAVKKSVEKNAGLFQVRGEPGKGAFILRAENRLKLGGGLPVILGKVDSETSRDRENRIVTVCPFSSVWLFSKTVRLSRFRYSATG